VNRFKSELAVSITGYSLSTHSKKFEPIRINSDADLKSFADLGTIHIGFLERWETTKSALFEINPEMAPEKYPSIDRSISQKEKWSFYTQSCDLC
jgi:hypothetical protein